MNPAGVILLAGAIVAITAAWFWRVDRKCPVCKRKFADSDRMFMHFDHAHLDA